MKISMILNGKKTEAEIDADMLLIDFVRSQGCYSVKRGCETSNCGLCTVFLDEKPVLSCSVLAARADGRTVTTLEGLQEEAAEFGAFIADQVILQLARFLSLQIRFVIMRKNLSLLSLN